MLYKRNQVEEAIAQVMGEPPGNPSSELRTRLKRLLDTDRGFGRKPRSEDPERANYAFYSSEAPGKGIEVEFQEYEAFALLTSLRLLQHGWPQGFAVNMLRGVRPDLERQHARILGQNPKALFNEEAIRKSAREGDFAFDNTDPVLLAIVSRNASKADNVAVAVCRGVKKLSEFARHEEAHSWTFFELATTVHRLHSRLSETQPRKRGRSH